MLFRETKEEKLYVYRITREEWENLRSKNKEKRAELCETQPFGKCRMN